MRWLAYSSGAYIVFLLAAAGNSQTVVVDAAPDHVVNSFSPARALGGAIDRLRGGPTKEENEQHTERLLTNPVLKEMLDAGWQTVTFRQNTELMIEAWHWNAYGTWSNAAKQEGYFVGSAEPTDEKIRHSWAYPLPHRGATLGDGNGWSRLTDGNLQSYWKSNPYLTQPYTGEDDSLHPQWVMIDLRSKVDVNAIRIAWANPYATRYIVQFWTGELEPFYDGINKGAWQAFPMGTITNGTGGMAILKLMNWKIPVRYLRIWMTHSSNTCDTHGREDKRNCLGYAINELYVGQMPDGGQFTDIVKHLPSREQTITWPSSVDPWHTASDLDYGRGDQIGFDFFFTCGVTRGLPAMIPIAILYNNPEDAANEIAYLYKRKYPISGIEMGEEPDGQRVLPEDYATLYLQFAKAIHNLTPEAPLGGPSFEGTEGDVDSWVDANGRVSFFGRFVDYLKAHGGLNDFTFFSFEHYPCGAGGGEGKICADWSSLYWEPAYVNHFPGMEGQRASAESSVLYDRRQRFRGRWTGNRETRTLASRLCWFHANGGCKRHLLFPLHCVSARRRRLPADRQRQPRAELLASISGDASNREGMGTAHRRNSQTIQNIQRYQRQRWQHPSNCLHCPASR